MRPELVIFLGNWRYDWYKWWEIRSTGIYILTIIVAITCDSIIVLFRKIALKYVIKTHESNVTTCSMGRVSCHMLKNRQGLVDTLATNPTFYVTTCPCRLWQGRNNLFINCEINNFQSCAAIHLKVNLHEVIYKQKSEF